MNTLNDTKLFTIFKNELISLATDLKYSNVNFDIVKAEEKFESLKFGSWIDARLKTLNILPANMMAYPIGRKVMAQILLNVARVI